MLVTLHNATPTHLDIRNTVASGVEMLGHRKPRKLRIRLIQLVGDALTLMEQSSFQPAFTCSKRSLAISR